MSRQEPGENQSLREVTNNILTNPITQIGLGQAQNYASMHLDKYQGFTGKIFTPELREYFNVNTSFVGKKLLKLIMPFKNYEWDDEIKRVELYIPIISFVTMILFSTLVQGINSQKFDPKMGKKILWIIILSCIEIGIAKFSESTISHLNIGILELTSFVSYRFVPLAALTIILTITNMSIPYLNLLGLAYLLLSDTYFCKLQLEIHERQVFREGSLGSKIALIVHFITTLVIALICDLI